jgi:hypothetical protein
VAALGLAVLTVVKSTIVWQSQETVIVTQDGFPWGRAIVEEVVPGATTVPKGQRFADPTRFISLAIIYSHFANGDPVKRLIQRSGPVNGKYEAAPVPSDDGNGFTPFINVTATADSAQGAVSLARRATNAFRSYLAQQQQANKIDAKNRVQLPVVKGPIKPTAIAGKSLTRPIFVFMLISLATVGLAFLLEKVRPREPEATGEVLEPVESLDPIISALEASRR